MKLRTKLFAGYGVVLILLAIIAGLVLINVTQLINIQGWVDHTWQVISRGNALGAAMVDQETGVRGYMITGDPGYLDPYNAGKENFSRIIAEVRELTSDNPAQVARWDDVAKMAQEWDTNVVARYFQMREDANDGAEAVQKFNEIQGRTVGKQIFDSLRGVISRIDAKFRAAGNTQGQLVTLNILMDMVNQETGQRGFLLTGLEESLEPYHNGQQSLQANLNSLRSLINSGRGSGVTMAEVAEVERLAGDWVAQAALPEIEARREVNLAKADMDDVADLVSQGLGKQYMDGIRAVLAEAVAVEEGLIDQRAAQAQATATATILITIIASILAIILGLSIATVITSQVAKQLGGEPDYIAELADRIYQGDLNIEFDDGGKQETGIYSAFKKMIGAFRVKASIIEAFSRGDLTPEIKLSSDKDALGRSLTLLSSSLNQTLGQVNMSVDQVNIGANQVSQSSQSLSKGATEQASSLEEISASINEINSQSRQNSESALEANQLASQAAQDATRGNEQMQSLAEAMAKINASSDEIKKVVKVIDDIAFQTNLLALNANVEAARAGKYGNGFAVVAEEVRNLAVRSGEAVKETTDMVDDSIKNIESGNQAVKATAEQLKSILSGSGKVAEFLSEIAVASKEQSEAIEQITQGLDQIDQVTQSNTASAEESASASEELASQATQLQQMISTFTLKNENGSSMGEPRQLTYEASEMEEDGSDFAMN